MSSILWLSLVMFISPYSNLASVSCICSEEKGFSQPISLLSQEPSQQTFQAASCSHQLSQVLPQFPSSSSQQARLSRVLSSAQILELRASCLVHQAFVHCQPPS